MASGSVFDRVLGQAPAIETLTRALRAGKLHHALRFEGPEGVGKELAALALAQSLVCEGAGPLGCGECSACRRALRISEQDPHVPLHPDVVLVERGLYPPSALGTQSRETAAIGVEQIRRVILARTGFSSHEGRALVFILREAHELTQQAANALLKTLEEPPPRVHFVLLTSRPNRLLDTIRSRTLAVRFGPLPEQVVAGILGARGLPADLARHAGGSASAALALADEDAARARAEFVQAAMTAVDAPDLDAAIAFSGGRPEDRDALRRSLLHLCQHLALEARDHVGSDPARSERSARRHGAVLSALDALERNAQPALALERLVVELRAI